MNGSEGWTKDPPHFELNEFSSIINDCKNCVTENEHLDAPPNDRWVAPLDSGDLSKKIVNNPTGTASEKFGPQNVSILSPTSKKDPVLSENYSFNMNKAMDEPKKIYVNGIKEDLEPSENDAQDGNSSPDTSHDPKNPALSFFDQKIAHDINKDSPAIGGDVSLVALSADVCQKIVEVDCQIFAINNRIQSHNIVSNQYSDEGTLTDCEPCTCHEHENSMEKFGKVHKRQETAPTILPSKNIVTLAESNCDIYGSKYSKSEDNLKSANETRGITDPTGRFERTNEVLGRGASKEVFKAFDHEEGVEVAWNQLKVGPMTEDSAEKIESEIRILTQLDNENVIRFYHSWVSKDPRTQQFEVIFITELMTSGTLRLYLQKTKGPIKLKVVKGWCRQILKALHYLHTIKTPPIIHRDLKCDNIFINGNNGQTKLGDFGLAVLKDREMITSVLGTPEFMAPELYDESYDERVDVYAFGMVLLELVTKEYPYLECENAAQIYRKVTQGTKPLALNRITDAETLAIIESCISHDPNQRPTVEQLLETSYFSLPPPVSTAEGSNSLAADNSTLLPSFNDNSKLYEKSAGDNDVSNNDLEDSIDMKILATDHDVSKKNDLFPTAENLVSESVNFIDSAVVNTENNLTNGFSNSQLMDNKKLDINTLVSQKMKIFDHDSELKYDCVKNNSLKNDRIVCTMESQVAESDIENIRNENFLIHPVSKHISTVCSHSESFIHELGHLEKLEIETYSNVNANESETADSHEKFSSAECQNIQRRSSMKSSAIETTLDDNFHASCMSYGVNALPVVFNSGLKQDLDSICNVTSSSAIIQEDTSLHILSCVVDLESLYLPVVHLRMRLIMSVPSASKEVKFPFDFSRDTVEVVVDEMIKERVLEGDSCDVIANSAINDAIKEHLSCYRNSFSICHNTSIVSEEFLGTTIHPAVAPNIINETPNTVLSRELTPPLITCGSNQLTTVTSSLCNSTIHGSTNVAPAHMEVQTSNHTHSKESSIVPASHSMISESESPTLSSGNFTNIAGSQSTAGCAMSVPESSVSLAASNITHPYNNLQTDTLTFSSDPLDQISDSAVQDHPEIALLLLKQAREIDLIALFHRREYQLLIRNLKGQMLSAALNGINNGSLNIGTGSRSRNEGSLFNGASSLPVLGSEFSGESVNAVSTLMQSSQVQYHNPSISNPGTTCNSVNNLASQLCNPVSNGSNQIPQTMFSGPGSSSIAAGFNSFTNPLHQNNPKGSPIINSQQCISGAIHQTGLANMSYHHSGNNINNQSNGSNVNSQLNNTNINSQLSGIGISNQLPGTTMTNQPSSTTANNQPAGTSINSQHTGTGIISPHISNNINNHQNTSNINNQPNSTNLSNQHANPSINFQQVGPNQGANHFGISTVNHHLTPQHTQSNPPASMGGHHKSSSLSSVNQRFIANSYPNSSVGTTSVCQNAINCGNSSTSSQPVSNSQHPSSLVVGQHLLSNQSGSASAISNPINSQSFPGIIYNQNDAVVGSTLSPPPMSQTSENCNSICNPSTTGSLTQHLCMNQNCSQLGIMQQQPMNTSNNSNPQSNVLFSVAGGNAANHTTSMHALSSGNTSYPPHNYVYANLGNKTISSNLGSTSSNGAIPGATGVTPSLLKTVYNNGPASNPNQPHLHQLQQQQQHHYPNQQSHTHSYPHYSALLSGNISLGNNGVPFGATDTEELQFMNRVRNIMYESTGNAAWIYADPTNAVQTNIVGGIGISNVSHSGGADGSQSTSSQVYHQQPPSITTSPTL